MPIGKKPACFHRALGIATGLGLTTQMRQQLCGGALRLSCGSRKKSTSRIEIPGLT